MVNKGHFNADSIGSKKNGLLERYNNLAEPVNKRKQILDDARNYQQFLHDVEDELSWIKEKEPVASSLHTGNTVIPLPVSRSFLLTMLKSNLSKDSKLQNLPPTPICDPFAFC